MLFPGRDNVNWKSIEKASLAVVLLIATATPCRAALSLAKVEAESTASGGSALKIKKEPVSQKTKLSTGKKTDSKSDYDASLISLYQMGLTHTDLRSVGDLIIELRREVSDNPAAPDLRMRLGSYLYITGDYEGAAMEMRRAIAIDPENHIGHLLLARLLEDAGDEFTEPRLDRVS